MKTPVSVVIESVGAYIPPKVLSNADLEKIVDTSDQWIFGRTGIRERRIVAEGMSTSDMAIEAALSCLASSKVPAAEIDLIIVASASPDYAFPSTACIVQHAILARTAAAFDMEIGCTGFIYALATGAQFISAGVYRNVMVIGAETLSRFVDWTDRNTCVLFGDGAGAALLTQGPAGEGILAFHLGADGSQWNLLSLPAGMARLPASEQTLKKGLHYIHMEGRAVFKFAVKAMDVSLKALLDKLGKTAGDIDLLIPHQANSRIIDSACQRFNIPREKIMMNIDKYGNTSSASIAIALYEAYSEGRIKKGDLVVLVGFGAGLSWGSLAIRW
ncbi:MAG TPA: ketoacyl-ACP synthase III [Firmicutes bacterium]|nr:ketoacyl-ACP synthase III [Candidatus Fermentithermobacillaceae bacterium]